MKRQIYWCQRQKALLYPSHILEAVEIWIVLQLFRCGYCISIRGYVCPLVGLLVHWSVGPLVCLLVRNAFVKIAKYIGKSLFFTYLCIYIACPSIHWSVRPLFCMSVHFSIHLSVHPSIHMSIDKL